MADDEKRKAFSRLGLLALIAIILYRLGILQGILKMMPGKQPGPGGTKPKPGPGKPQWKEQAELELLHNDRIVKDPKNPYGTRVEKGPAKPLEGGNKETLVLTYSVSPGALSVQVPPTAMAPTEQDYFGKNFPNQPIPLSEVLAFRLNRRLGYFVERGEATGRGATWTWAPESDAHGVRYIVRQGQGADSVQFHVHGIRGNDARAIGQEIGGMIENLLQAHRIGFFDPIGRGKYTRG